MSSKPTSLGLKTRLMHSGHGDGLSSHSMPIFPTTTFKFSSVEEGEDIFSGKTKKDAYSRISNPNFRNLEEGLCILEGGETTQVFDSGMSAIKVLLQSILKLGNEVIAHNSLYGGTTLLLKDLINFGIETRFVDARQTDNVLQVLSNRTKLIFIETPSNPTLDICDFQEIKEKLITAGRKDILVAVDNTFATPCNQKPLANEADVVVESLTKYINGFGNATGGSITTSQEIMDIIWKRYSASGGMLAPEVASKIATNMQTIDMRVALHNSNAVRISEYLASHPCVSRVYYPGFSSHPNHHIARRLMSGFGGVVSFELREPRSRDFLNKLALDNREGRGVFSLAVSLGSVDSLVCCPALSTHLKVPKAERKNQRINDDLIRLSIGIEDIDDIISSLDSGFNAISTAI